MRLASKKHVVSMYDIFEHLQGMIREFAPAMKQYVNGVSHSIVRSRSSDAALG